MTPTSRAGQPELEVVRGALADDYDILEEIGRGGMAIVYRARERALERDVAIKVLPPHLAFDESFVDRFQREGRIAAQLEHPHIVPIYRVGRSGQVIYIVMKLLRGESLSARLASRGTLPAAEVGRILAETAGALGYAARRGVVHRDVKPHNVMFDDDGRCVVTDFGIARSGADSKLTATGMSVGTPRYMSPEQARAKPLDGRSDLYSLGVVGYECLVGVTPFDGEDAFAILMAHVRAPVPRPALRSEEEAALFAVIERLLAKDPEDRFQSGEEVVAALGEQAFTAKAGERARRRADALSPTQPAVAAQAPTTRTVFHEDSGPEPSLALDRALQAGLELIKQQVPRLGAGLRALTSGQPARDAETALAVRAPRSESPLAIYGRRALAAAAGASSIARRAHGYVAGRGRRFWGGVGAAGFLAVSSYYGVHFATKHRSRCPKDDVVPAVALQGDPEDVPDARPVRVRRRPFSVLVDPVRPQRSNATLDVYYDVCGLEAGAPSTVQVSVTKIESGLKRILGGSVEPVRTTYDETAPGPRTRRHRTLDLAGMPDGSYRLVVVVTDAEGRRRSKAVEFRVLDR